jgi:hypothetical protein
MEHTRRRVLASIGMAALKAAMSPRVKKAGAFSATAPLAAGMDTSTCPFRR